jgi:hypothetical protein
VSDRSPVYVLPLAEGATSPRTPEAARAMVAMAAEAPESSGLRTAVSSDSWHPTLAAKLARACSIEGLGFLANELRVLSSVEARGAAEAVDSLLRRLEEGDIPESRDSFGRQWDLIISQADLAEAIAAVVPCCDVDEENGEVESFLEFLVAVQIAATDAGEQGTGLLFLRPEA